MILFNRNDSLISDLLTPTGGFNLTFKVTLFYFYSNEYSIFVTLEHKTSLKSLEYICSNSQQYIVWVKIINFSFMPKIIRILSKDHVPSRFKGSRFKVLYYLSHTQSYRV